MKLLIASLAAMTLSPAAPAAASTPAAQPAAAALEIAADRDGRIVTLASVNGAGPFRFLVDTGANRTAISPRLAAALGLPEAGRAEVIGVTGRVEAGLVRVAALEAGALRIEDFSAPVVGAGALGAADGIIAATDLSRLKVNFDFDRRTVTIAEPNPAGRPGRREARLPARFLSGSIVAVRAELGGRPVTAVIDTGSEFTLVNGPLLARLRARGHVSDPEQTFITSVGEQPVAGVLVSMPALTLGEVDLTDFAAVGAARLDVLDGWGLSEEPTVILGMNVLAALDTLTIDYAARRVTMTYTRSPSTLFAEREQRWGRTLENWRNERVIKR